MTLIRSTACKDQNPRRNRWRSGNVAVMFGILLPVAVGACGLGADVGYWYYKQRTLQSAADSAAYAGAVALKSGGSSSSVTNAATSSASANGWSISGGSITVNSPPTSGSYQNAYSVQVILTQNLPRFFSGLYSGSAVPASATAVASYAGSVGCILALDPTANQAVTVSGGSSLQAPHCDVISDSNSSDSIDVSGGSTVQADCLVAVGTSKTGNGNVTLDSCTTPTNNASAVADPYASVAEPTSMGSCITVQGGQTDFYPGNYCNGLSVSWGPVTFHSGSGPYVVTNGGLNFQAGTIATGTGVTFYVGTGQTAAVSGSAVISFSAPTSGAYSGLLFFGSRESNNGNNNFSGNSSSTLAGAIYFPTQQVQFTGASSTSTVCTQIVADTVVVSGTSGFNGNACLSGSSGTQTISVADGAVGSLRLVQ